MIVGEKKEVDCLLNIKLLFIGFENVSGLSKSKRSSHNSLMSKSKSLVVKLAKSANFDSSPSHVTPVINTATWHLTCKLKATQLQATTVTFAAHPQETNKLSLV